MAFVVSVQYLLLFLKLYIIIVSAVGLLAHTSKLLIINCYNWNNITPCFYESMCLWALYHTVCFEFFPKADSALRSGNAELVLEVVRDLVNATAAEDRAQFPRDLNTTNDIITNTLDLFTRNLDQANNNTNITALDVC